MAFTPLQVHIGPPTGVGRAPSPPQASVVVLAHTGGGIVKSQVVFPPTQGLEIVNPQAAEKKVAEANQKYFSSMAEFLKVKGEKSGIMST